MLVFSPPDKLEENKAILLEAAEQILNPPAVKLSDGSQPGNQGGGKVLFLLVDTSKEENIPLLNRAAVPLKTSKSGVVRLAQFPSKRPLEIFKPVGKYKVSAKQLVKFLNEVRNSGKGATRTLMTEEKVKKFSTINTKKTLLRAVGSTARCVVMLSFYCAVSVQH